MSVIPTADVMAVRRKQYRGLDCSGGANRYRICEPWDYRKRTRKNQRKRGKRG